MKTDALRFRLHPDEAQRQALVQTIVLFNQAATWVYRTAKQEKVLRLTRLRKLCYQWIRTRAPQLPSRMVELAIRKGRWARRCYVGAPDLHEDYRNGSALYEAGSVLCDDSTCKVRPGALRLQTVAGTLDVPCAMSGLAPGRAIVGMAGGAGGMAQLKMGGDGAFTVAGTFLTRLASAVDEGSSRERPSFSAGSPQEAAGAVK